MLITLCLFVAATVLFRSLAGCILKMVALVGILVIGLVAGPAGTALILNGAGVVVVLVLLSRHRGVVRNALAAVRRRPAWAVMTVSGYLVSTVGVLVQLVGLLTALLGGIAVGAMEAGLGLTIMFLGQWTIRNGALPGAFEWLRTMPYRCATQGLSAVTTDLVEIAVVWRAGVVAASPVLAIILARHLAAEIPIGSAALLSCGIAWGIFVSLVALPQRRFARRFERLRRIHEKELDEVLTSRRNTVGRAWN